METGLFERARKSRDFLKDQAEIERIEAELEHEKQLEDRAVKTAELIREIFGVDAELQAHRYGNEYPVLGGVLLGTLWFEAVNPYTLKVQYVCLNECYLKGGQNIRWRIFTIGDYDQDKDLSTLADLADEGCKQCFQHTVVTEPSAA